MKNKALNCWEYKKCGREPGGAKAAVAGACPAATEKSLDGIHRGDNAGRACWIIAGTFCGGKPQGDFAAKLDSCASCDFFNLVLAEEKMDLQAAEDLRLILDVVTRSTP